MLEDKPLLVKFVYFPEVLSGQHIAIGLASVVVDVHYLNLFPMEHLEDKPDFFLNQPFIWTHEPALGEDPLGFSVAILLFKQFYCLLYGNIMGFGVVAQLVVVSFGNVHVDDVSVLLLLEEPFLVLRLENVPALILQSLVQTRVFGLVLPMRAHEPVLLLLLPIIHSTDLLFLVFLSLLELFSLFDFSLFLESVQPAALHLLLF